LDIGIDLRLGHNVENYFETDTKAGVIANGVRSKGRTIVLGYEDKPKSLGYAIYRTWFDSAKVAEDPDIRWMVENGDKHCAWLGMWPHFSRVGSKVNDELGPNIHFIAASVKD
jgi:hypothetical protein